VAAAAPRAAVGLLSLVVAALIAAPQIAGAAQRAFFILQSPAAETVAAGVTTNYAITLTYSNASGTINSAVFTNGVSVSPPGQGVTASLSSIYAGPINSGGGTTNLTLTVSAASSAPANTTYQIIVSATNSSFTANVPPGVAAITNSFVIGPPANSNGFTMALAPAAASCRAGAATNFTATVTLVDCSATISGTITNGVTVSGPDPANVTANLNTPYAALTNNFGQTNLTLSISVNPSAAGGAYTVTVSGTNSAFTDNATPGVASAAFTLDLTLLKQFTVGLDPPTEAFMEGAAGVVGVAVTLTNLSDALAETITNSVTVIGPDPANDITAGLSAAYASPSARGGTATLTLSITNNGSSLPGAYQVIVTAANGDFTDNTPAPGVASATNSLTVTPLPFSIQSFGVIGTNLTVTGAGGGPNWPYLVYASTNLALPLSQWTPILTNVYDANGRFSVAIALANTVDPNAASQFFVLAFPGGTNAVATPTFSPPARAYFAETPVTIASATSGALIRYTTDGSLPTESNGALYTGPVTMRGPVNTNSTGTITNASGVTMLKAVAYKGGMRTSDVWTGIYTILDPVAYPPAATPSPVCGIAHMAYTVTSSNWDNTVSLWTNYYGFGAVVASNDFALVKINDQQYVEMYRVPLLVSNQWQLANYGYEVTNAEAYRELLATNGMSVPAGVTTNALGNLSFLTVDPDGHTNEWVQYLTNSVTGRSLGHYMPGTQVAGFANCFGILTIYGSQDNVSGPPITYYVDECGFLGPGNSLDFPNGGKIYIELLTAGSGGATQDTAGKHGKLQLMNFRGMTIWDSINLLTNRNPSIPGLIVTEGRHYAFDVDTLDLSRIRLNDY